MASTIKVNNIQNQCGQNIINENSNTITIGASGDTIALASGASQTGFGRTGTVDWQTGSIKTTTFTAASGEGYFANTSGSAFNMNLPAGVAGAIVSVADYGDNFNTNPLTIVPNGSDKLGGVNANAVLGTQGQSVTLVFVDSVEGWITVNDSTENVTQNPNIVATGGSVATCGNCKIHTFTGPGTFNVTNISTTPANNTVSYLVIAGGGGTGHPAAGYSGGAGAGGYREVKSPTTPYTASPLDGYPNAPNRVTITATSFPITVGAGGTGRSNGSVSTFSTISSAGGGFGALNSLPVPERPASAGGSGGGGNYCKPAAGAGNTPPTTPAQGNNGGTGETSPPAFGSGGGGGAGAVGENGSTSKGGNGGAGTPTEISGSAVTRAGGGGGYAVNSGIPGGTGGSGGGGDGYGPAGPPGTGPGSQGTVNTGGGAGGAAGCTENSGGSGIVIIRYKYQ